MAKRHEPAVIVFDNDGTLTPKMYSLYSVVDALLPEDARQQLVRTTESYMQMLHRGRLSRRNEVAWLEASCKMYVRHGLTRSAIESAIGKMPLRPGAPECFHEADAANLPTAIVSYGIKPFIEIMLDHNGLLDVVSKVYSTHLRFSKRNGKVVGYDLDTVVTPSMKGHCSREFAGMHGVKRTRIFAVGDSVGDRMLGYLKKNRVGIVEDHADVPKVARHMHEVIVSAHFSPVRDWLDARLFFDERKKMQ